MVTPDQVDLKANQDRLAPQAKRETLVARVLLELLEQRVRLDHWDQVVLRELLEVLATRVSRGQQDRLVSLVVLEVLELQEWLEQQDLLDLLDRLDLVEMSERLEHLVLMDKLDHLEQLEAVAKRAPKASQVQLDRQAVLARRVNREVQVARASRDQKETRDLPELVAYLGPSDQQVV